MLSSFRICGAFAVVPLMALVVPEGVVAEQVPRSLTVTEAIDEARARSPVLRAQRALVEQAEARLLAARTYPFNPEVAVEAARRSNGDSATDRELRLGQEIEIGGQRKRRTAEATAQLEASRSALLREERLLQARVRAAFVEALRARELEQVERANAELARSLADVARKRLESGAVAQMEVNLAQVQVGRANRELTLARGAYEVARSTLAEVIGLNPADPPEVDGKLEPPVKRLLPVPEILAAAEKNRADLQALRRTIESTRARVELARRQSIPNLDVEAFYGREDGTDRLVGGGIAVRVPIFNRNRGEVAEARAAQRRAEAETAAAAIEVDQQVVAAIARFHSSVEASVSLRREVLGTLEENLQLLQRSFEAGKTNWTEVLVFRREFVDAQRDYIETVADAVLAGIELDLASAGMARGEEARP